MQISVETPSNAGVQIINSYGENYGVGKLGVPVSGYCICKFPSTMEKGTITLKGYSNESSYCYGSLTAIQIGEKLS